MKNYRVIFEVHKDRNRTERKEIIVEAGDKSKAYKRGLVEMSKMKEYTGYFKNIVDVEEVK